ncbi:hypothetical protein C8R45DRAFT_1018022, partial [Mycena sanguinolenta]
MDHTAVTRSATKARTSEVASDPNVSLPPLESTKRKLESVEPLGSQLSSNKRAKNTSQTFAKHSRFWALDGNVILQFDSVAFKVHRSRLSTQSVWFEKLFEKRAGRDEPLEDDEKDINDVVAEDLDGTDVFHLDKVGTLEDFEALLSAMEDAIDFSYASPSFFTLAAIFRAASTFKFHKFKKFAKQSLLDMFSSDLNYIGSTVVPSPAAAVLLGRDWNLPGILKRAFYEILRTQPADSVSNGNDDGTESEANPLEEWGAADIIRLGETQKRFMNEWLTLLTPFISPATCKVKPACSTRSAGRKVIAEVLGKYRLDPICGLNALIMKNWVKAHDFCKVCEVDQSKSFLDKRTHLWEDMDIWLGIPEDDDEED